MKIRRFFTRLYRDPEPGVEGSGADTVVAPTLAPEAAAGPVAAPIAPVEGVVEAPAAVAPASTAPPADPNAPKTLLEAISASVDGKKPDPKAAPGALDPKKAPEVVDPAAPKPAAKPEDVTAMPEGLAPKAQERFRALANVNKEMTQEVESLRAQTEYIGTSFKQNGITQPQFEVAVGLIGAMNRGDWPTVIKGMQEQMRQVALLSGQPIDGIDALVGMPDLKEKVENLQLTREDAAEMARARTERQMLQHRAQQSQRERERHEQGEQQAQQHERARQQAVLAVDQLCAELKRTDLDFGRIEAALLPRVAEMFSDLPPAKWADAFKRQYDLMKSMGAPARGNSAGTLRAGGADNPVARPATMFQAMFGEVQP